MKRNFEDKDAYYCCLSEIERQQDEIFTQFYWRWVTYTDSHVSDFVKSASKKFNKLHTDLLVEDDSNEAVYLKFRYLDDGEIIDTSVCINRIGYVVPAGKNNVTYEVDTSRYLHSNTISQLEIDSEEFFWHVRHSLDIDSKLLDVDRRNEFFDDIKIIAQKLKRLHFKHTALSLQCFESRLEQNVLAAMKASQFSGRVFYNWLLGCPRAWTDSVNAATYAPDPKLAEARQRYVMHHPQMGHMIGLILMHGKATTTLTPAPANERLFNYEANVSGLVPLDAAFVGQELYLANIRKYDLTQLVQTPSFWRGAELDFWTMHDEFRNVGNQPLSFIHQLAASLQTIERQKQSQPTIPKGLVL